MQVFFFHSGQGTVQAAVAAWLSPLQPHPVQLLTVDVLRERPETVSDYTGFLPDVAYDIGQTYQRSVFLEHYVGRDVPAFLGLDNTLPALRYELTLLRLPFLSDFARESYAKKLSLEAPHNEWQAVDAAAFGAELAYGQPSGHRNVPGVGDILPPPVPDYRWYPKDEWQRYLVYYPHGVLYLETSFALTTEEMRVVSEAVMSASF